MAKGDHNLDLTLEVLACFVVLLGRGTLSDSAKIDRFYGNNAARSRVPPAINSCERPRAEGIVRIVIVFADDFIRRLVSFPLFSLFFFV